MHIDLCLLVQPLLLLYTPGVVKIVVHPLQTPESFENKSATQLRDEIHNMISSALPYRQAEDEPLYNLVDES